MTPLQLRTDRAVRAVLLVVVALCATMLVATSGHDHAAHAEGGHAATHAHGDGAPAAAMSASEARLHDGMRELWEDHIVWTRAAIVTFAAATDDTAAFDASAQRLLRNQADIGHAMKPYFGKKAGRQLTAVLRDHITIAVEVLQAAKAGDAEGFEEARTRWYANGNDVADTISGLDRRVWPRQAVRDMMRTHLDQTLAEASAELTGDYPASVAAYDAIHQHILAMADALTEGIVAAFPGKFR